jgi:hypothetical protein
MDSCHTPRPLARRSFIVTPYTVGSGGVLVPVMPQQCIAVGDDCGGQHCRIRIQHWRPRKTGPGYPLLVAKCRTHGVAFTLYPPGHVPYGRVAMAPVDLAGRPLEAAAEEDEPLDRFSDKPEPSQSVPLAWRTTLFGAAQDAADGQSWPRRNSTGPGSWRTQGRWILLGALLLGLTGGLEERAAQQGLLGVSELTRRDAATAYAAAPGYRERGQAVTRPLVELEQAGSLMLDWLLFAGCVARRWGSPRRCDPGSGQLRWLIPRARAP